MENTTVRRRDWTGWAAEFGRLDVTLTQPLRLACKYDAL